MSRIRALSVFEKSLRDNLHIDFPNTNKVSGWMWWKRFGDFDLKSYVCTAVDSLERRLKILRDAGGRRLREMVAGWLGQWVGELETQAVGLRPGSVQSSMQDQGVLELLCVLRVHLWNNVSHGPSLLELLWRLCGLIYLKHCVLVHKNV